MSEGGSLLSQHELIYTDLSFSDPMRVLGEGSFGTVYHAVYRGNETVAVKTMRVGKISSVELEKFKSEIIIMAPLQHPYLVRLYGGVWNEGADKLCIVLEYCSNGSLGSLLKKRGSETWASAYFGILLNTAVCFRYLHFESSGETLIHRDLKPDNVLIAEDMSARVADFGESRRFNHKEASMRGDDKDSSGVMTMTMVGTLLYCAPEASIPRAVLRRRPPTPHA